MISPPSIELSEDILYKILVAEVAGQRGLAAVEAYMLCSVAADLRISEIVDQPNWVVSLYFPRLVFE